MRQWLESLQTRFQDPLRRRILKNLLERMTQWIQGGDPRITLRPFAEADWLCPFCAEQISTPHWNGAEQAVLQDMDVLRHLEACTAIGPGFKMPEILPWETLVKKILALRVKYSHTYRCANSEGSWICPHCLEDTGIPRYEWDGSVVPTERCESRIIEHLEKCAACLLAPLRPHGEVEIAAWHAPQALRLRFLERLQQDPLFQVFDSAGRWIDPFDLKPVEHLNRNLVTLEQGLFDAIVNYLLSPGCSGRSSNWRTAVTVEALYRAAGRSDATAPAVSAHLPHMRKVHLTPVSRWVNIPHGPALAGSPQDLAHARDIQIRMLPSRPPEVPGYEISTFYEPCEMLGGDFFQFAPAGAGRTGFLIADVSGHGTEAAMLMAMALKSFGVRALGRSSPADVLCRVAHDMATDLPRGKFITAFYAILEHDTGKLLYARAGHNPGMLVDAERRSILELTDNGLALGVATPKVFESKLEEGIAMLPLRASILLYTDGLSEARDPSGEPFGEGRLEQTLLREGDQSSQMILDEILEDFRLHTGTGVKEDDVTIVVLKRTAASAP